VGSNFRRTGKLEAADFYTPLIWSADRAKNYHGKRLKDKAATFESAVPQIAAELYDSADGK
jgi:hypothetical protein